MLTDLDLKLLERIVERYDEGRQPVTPAALSDVLDADATTIEACIDDLVANEMLAPVDDGYRPTITARELLDLDIDLEGSLIVLEFEAPDDEQPSETRDDGPDSPGEDG
jgi:predicted transcriptional regulator